MLLAAALAYAAAGIRVLPLHSSEGGVCSCGVPACRSAGKHPRTARGFLDATSDSAQVLSWWNAEPQSNIGLRMGQGIIALDIDFRSGGQKTWIELQLQHGDCPDTTTQSTGNGLHLLFAWSSPLALRGSLGPGVDVKSNGYICAAPSVHSTGLAYRWLSGLDLLAGDVPAALPQWLASLLVHGSAPEGVGASTPVPAISRALADASQALAHLDSDNYAQWIEAGMALHQEDSGVAGFEVWDRWSRQSQKYDAAIQDARWRSFRSRLDGVTIASIFHQAQSAGWINPNSQTTQPPLLPPEVAPKPGPVPGFTWQPGDLFGRSFTPPEYCIDGLLLRGYLHGLTGLSNAGKTAIGLSLSYAVASGTPFGDRATAQGKVLFLAGENPEDLRLRVQGLSQFHGSSLHLDQITVAFARFDLAPNLPHLRTLAEEAGGFALVVVDSAAAFFSGEDENSNPEMGRYALLLRSLTQLSGRPAVLVLCHPTKHASVEMLHPRGGSAFLNELDTNFSVSRDGEVVTLGWNKVRGPAFDPIAISLVVHKFDLVTNLGSPITTVIASPLADRQIDVLTAAATAEEDRLLDYLRSLPLPPSYGDICAAMQWVTSTGKRNSRRVDTVMSRLQSAKLVRKYRGKWALTAEARSDKKHPRN